MTTVIHVAGMENEMAEAQKEMDNMSPEEKAMMKNMMGGMGMKMGAQAGGMSITHTQCITNDNPVPKDETQKNCESNHTIKGNTVNFETTCPDSHSTGQLTFNNDSMKGTIESTSTQKGKKENVTMDINGQYVGPCTGSETFSSADLSEKEMALQKDSNTKSPNPKAVNTTNNVKNTLNGLKALMGK